MADDPEQGWWRRSLLQLRRTVTVLVFAAGLTLGAGVMLHNKQEDLQQQQQQQSAQIERLQAQVTILQQASGEPPPAVCRCQKATENGVLLHRFCLAKNAICDEESARICQAQLPDYQC